MEESHVDEDNSENKVNETLKIQTTILDNFKKLTKDKDNVRIKAGAHLVKYLLENETVETEMKYALGRLVRGLGSSTINARCGFYSTLVPLLNFSNITVDQIFDHVNKELRKAKSNFKSENADISTGQVLVCEAIIRSELFARSSEEDQAKVLQCLINAGKERSYLLFPSYQIILDLAEKFSKKSFESQILPLIQSELEKPLMEYNLDMLYLLISLRNRYTKMIGKIWEKKTGTSELLTEDNLRDFTTILMSIPRITSLQHPVYQLFVKILVKTELTTKFIAQVDAMLVKHNKNKHLVTINLLIFILKDMENPNQVPHLLEKNLIQQTLTVFRQVKGGEKNSELKQLTHKLFNAILETLKKEEVESNTKILVIKKLLFFPGTFIFEKLTKSKLIQQITGILNVDGVKNLTELYKEVILLQHEKFNVESCGMFPNNDRLYAAHLLVKLLSHSAMHDENGWKCEQLKFLMRLGLTKQPKIGVELAGSLKDTFLRALDLKLSKLDDLSAILFELFNYLDSLISEDTLEISLRLPITSETYETWTNAKTLINKIEPKKKKKVKLVFQILFLHLGLQLFNDVKLAKDSLEELFSCYKRIKKDKTTENEDDPAWIEVIIELLLSLLSHNSNVLRKVISCVFPHLCHYLNASAIHQLLSVLDPKSEENPLRNKNDISDEESELSDEEEEEGEKNDVDEDSEEEEEDESSEDEDMDETNNDKLRRALHEALMENDRGDQSDIDLDELDEEQGEKLNEVLGEVFKQFKTKKLGNKSKKQDKNEETLTHFRVRVLDLIEIYIESEPAMILTLEIMLPLLQILEFSIKDDHQKPLQDRLKACLRKLSALKKFKDTSEVTDKVICDLLESLLDKGTKSTLMIQFMGEELAQCCTFLIRCSQNLINIEETPKKVKKHLKRNIVNILKQALDTYLRKRDCYIPFVVFKQTLQINWNGNFELIKLLSTAVFEDDIRPFKRSQAVEMLRLCYSNHRLLTNVEESVKEDVVETTKELLKKALNFFNELVNNEGKSKVREKFLSFLFILLTTIKHSPIKCEEFKWQELGQAIRECRSYLKINQDTKRSFNRLCSSFGLSNVVEMKKSTLKLENKNDDDNSSTISGVVEKKKIKHKKNKETLKLKKEAKEERMKSLSEGLEGGFSNIRDVNGMELDEEEEDIKENGESNNVELNKSKKRKVVNGEHKKSKRNKT